MGRIEVRVIPNASRSEVAGWQDGRLKIKVQAPPEGGRANKEVCLLMARQLDVAKREVAVVSGLKSRLKTVEVESLTDAQLVDRFSE